MTDLLLDTGAFVALLDKSEKNHLRCVQFFKSFEGRLLTTEPVLTETIYLLGPSVKPQKAALEFISERWGCSGASIGSKPSASRGPYGKIQRYSHGFCRRHLGLPGGRDRD
jgi:predicted nucleic acid-binding protein